MKIVVTGSKGFIGSHMVKLLLTKGHVVIPVGREECNLSSLEDVLNFLRTSNAEYVFHFAADMGGVGYFSVAQYYPFVNNARIDLNIIEACRQLNIPLFYPSSACIYPTHKQTEKGLREDQIVPANPDQMYGWEKLMVTLISEQLDNMRVGILHTIFGTDQTWVGEKTKFPPSIVYKTILLKKHGTPIEIWGDGTQKRTFLYITDALEKMYEVAFSSKYWGPVNISSDEVVTVRQCADICCKIAGVKPDYIFNTTKPSGVMFRGADTSKFHKHYKYIDQVSTEEGFEKLFRWMEPQIK